ncbi:MAG: CotH kinase family protein [Polyangiaceae bacterium]|nr:CotH kinase family protein [Polyangiaceae bacterium]
MRKKLVGLIAGLASGASLLASCGDSPSLGLVASQTPENDAGSDAADEADTSPPPPPPPPAARIIQIAAWPGRGVQIAVELDQDSAGAGLPEAWLEQSPGMATPAAVKKPDMQGGITAILVVPAADPAIHAERLAAAAALIDALPAGESMLLLVARAKAVLMAERSVDRAHAAKRLLEIAPEPGRSAADALDSAQNLLADCGGPAGPLYRTLLVVGDAAADNPAVGAVQTLALTDTGSPGPAAADIVAKMAARRAAIVRIGACLGLDGGVPISLHVGGSIAKVATPAPMDHMLAVPCDPIAAAGDDYPFPAEIQLSFTAAERAIYDTLYSTNSDEDFKTSVTLGISTPIPAEAHFHGQSSLGCQRKSFSVHMEGKRRRWMPEVADDRFFLISMCLDTRYFGQVWGERLLASLGLFPPRQRYVRLRIDGENQGVYLVVQRPEDAVRTDGAGVVSVIRRRYDIQGEPAEVKYPEDPPAVSAALAAYDELAAIATTAPSADIASELDARIDLDAYLRWLAVNSLLQNGDFIDEAFFYASAENNAWFHRAMGWDLDDLFSACHGGGGNAIIDPCGLTYCTEGLLDQALIRSPEVYQRYLAALGFVLDILTPERLAASMNAVRSELWEILNDDETSAALVEMVQDNPAAVSVSAARADIESHMDEMLADAVSRREQLKQSLAACAP